jgi:hypothetical protein
MKEYIDYFEKYEKIQYVGNFKVCGHIEKSCKSCLFECKDLNFNNGEVLAMYHERWKKDLPTKKLIFEAEYKISGVIDYVDHHYIPKFLLHEIYHERWDDDYRIIFRNIYGYRSLVFKHKKSVKIIFMFYFPSDENIKMKSVTTVADMFKKTLKHVDIIKEKEKFINLKISEI